MKVTKPQTRKKDRRSTEIEVKVKSKKMSAKLQVKHTPLNVKCPNSLIILFHLTGNLLIPEIKLMKMSRRIKKWVI